MSKKVKKPGCTLEQLQLLGTQELKVGEQVLGSIRPREFSSGSYGLGLHGPIDLKLPDGKVVECQASISITVKHSKPAETEQ